MEISGVDLAAAYEGVASRQYEEARRLGEKTGLMLMYLAGKNMERAASLSPTQGEILDRYATLAGWWRDFGRAFYALNALETARPYFMERDDERSEAMSKLYDEVKAAADEQRREDERREAEYLAELVPRSAAAVV